MASLEEYLGGILAGVSEARVLGDIQTLHTAEAYAKSDLLRHFPVPRMRIASAELTIPVAIERLESKRRLIVSNEETDRLGAELVVVLARAAGIVRLTDAMRVAVNAVIDPCIADLVETFPAMGPEGSIKAFASKLAETFVGFMAKSPPNPTRTKIDQVQLAEAIQKLATARVKGVVSKDSLAKLEVVAESHRLREQRPSDVIMIKLNISEEGMEWQFMENANGETQRKLLPE